MGLPPSLSGRCRSLLFLASIALVIPACARRDHPNVLVITIDTLRADHLGCYGYWPAHTPNIDALAAGGVRCTNAIAAAPITMPAHTSIFTGLLPPRHGVRDNGSFALDDRAVTLAERLRDAGYTTHAFVSAIVLSRRYHLDQGFETYDDDLWSEDEPKLFMIRERPAIRTADRFLSWLSSWERGGKQKPFFTWIHFFDPHQPYDPPAEDRASAASPYDGEIASVDRQIGRIVAALKRDGLYDDTVIILTADHGESLGEHGEKTHAVFVYDATVHVPLIVRDPRMRSSTYEAPVRSVDIVPTILGRLRLPGGDSTDGTDLMAAFRGSVAPPRLVQYSESLLSELGFGFAPLYSIRDGRYKWIRAPRPELYDLERDPHEVNNLYTRERRTASRLDGELSRILEVSGTRSLRSQGSPMTRETQEALQALGYLAPAGQRNSMAGIDPKDGMPIYQKLEDARHLAQQGRWDDAGTLLRQLLAVTPRNVSAINVLGLVSLRTHRLDEAKRWYQQSLAIDPAQFRVLGVLGGIEMTQGNLDDAARYFNDSVRANQNFAEGWANLGFIEALRGHDERAEELYRKGIAADSTFPRVQRRLADLYYLRGDFAKARAYYEATVRILPSDAQAMIQAGNSARRTGDAVAARAWFEKALRLRSGWWVPRYNLACLEAQEGNHVRAMEELRQSVGQGLDLSQFAGKDPDLAPLENDPEFKRLVRSTATR